MSKANGNYLSGVHKTAFSAAALRAAHMLCGSEPLIFRDELALALTAMPEAEIIALGHRVPAASASTCVLRSRYAEDRLAAACHRLDQYVVLGAGLDSYALRMADRLGNLTVFEVDDPPFQAWKRRRIAKLGLALPPRLRFVPCDFERARLEDALADGGFADDRPCFVSWLGVTQYLTRDAIRKMLAWAGSRPAGSEIVLTFLESNAQAKGLQASMAQAGVAVLSHFTHHEVTAMLRESGFTRIDHLSPAEAQERYFRDRTDGLEAPQIQRLVSATVEA
jgi:methyltransferase (TIGR00027 family)